MFGVQMWKQQQQKRTTTKNTNLAHFTWKILAYSSGSELGTLTDKCVGAYACPVPIVRVGNGSDNGSVSLNGVSQLDTMSEKERTILYSRTPLFTAVFFHPVLW